MQSDIRWQQRFANFSKAYKQLSGAVQLMQERQLTELEKHGTIHTFEYSYELGCNVLKDYLTWQGTTGLSGSRDTLREAFQVQLIEDGDGWMDMLQDRNRTSPTYIEEAAAAILTNIRGRYLELFSALYNKMKGLKAGSEKPMSAGQKQHTLEELAHTSGLGTQVIRKINAIFQKYPSLQQAVLYGSRAKGNWRKESDIDLTLFGEEITWDQFLAIEREVDDLLLPWRVDLSLYHQIDNKALREHIDRVGVLLYQSEAGATPAVGGRRQ